MRYNTIRSQMAMPEYGRNIQEMVDYLKTIEDKEKRQKNALAIIDIMGILNPQLKNVEDFKHKLWDHLFRIADFDLDIESPYPIPTRESLSEKPEPLAYPSQNRNNRHIGKNISVIIQKALAEEDEEKKKGMIQTIGYYMKLAYSNWHHENVHDDMIKEEINNLTNGALEYNPNTGLRVNTNFRRYNNNNNGSGFSNNRNGKFGQNKNNGNNNNGRKKMNNSNYRKKS